MATIEEQEALMAQLKFTPCTYQISMWGYGGEIAMGTVDRKIYDYFRHRRISVSDYAWDFDSVEELNIPEDMQPFEPGSWYECDDLAHASGVNRDSGTLQINDESGATVLERSLDSIDGTDIGLCCDNEAWIGMVAPGNAVFVGHSHEKGTFFEGEIELTAPFDLEKLELYYEEIDGQELVTQVYYDGEDICNNGANTNGKSSEFCLCLIKENNEFDIYRDHDSIKYPLTNWFSKRVTPAYLGEYEIETAGKDSYKYRAKWTGSRWLTSWQDDVPESESIDIKRWRGITYNPDADVEWDPVAELDKIIASTSDECLQEAADAINKEFADDLSKLSEEDIPKLAGKQKSWPF